MRAVGKIKYGSLIVPSAYTFAIDHVQPAGGWRFDRQPHAIADGQRGARIDAFGGQTAGWGVLHEQSRSLLRLLGGPQSPEREAQLDATFRKARLAGRIGRPVTGSRIRGCLRRGGPRLEELLGDDLARLILTGLLRRGRAHSKQRAAGHPQRERSHFHMTSVRCSDGLRQ